MAEGDKSVGGLTVQVVFEGGQEAAKGLANIGQAAGSAAVQLDRAGFATVNLEHGLGKMNISAGNARLTLLSMGQVIQDAPYGIRGVANNIEFLTQNFALLAGQAGGVGGAFKVLMHTMTGATGILFGVSVLTSALVFLSLHTGKSKEATKEATDAWKDYKKALEDIPKDLVKVLPETEAAMREANKQMLDMKQARLDIYRDMLKQVEKAEKEARVSGRDPIYSFVFPDETLKRAGMSGAGDWMYITTDKIREAIKTLMADTDILAKKLAAILITAKGPETPAERERRLEKEKKDAERALADEEKLETKRYDIREKYTETKLKEQQKAATFLLDKEQEMVVQRIADKFDREKAGEDARYQKELADIDDAITTTMDWEAKKRLYQLAEEEHGRRMVDIEKQRAEFQKRQAEEIIRNELRALMLLERQFSVMSTALGSLFDQVGDNFIKKMLKALDAVMAIIRALQVAKSMELAGEGGFLSTVGTWGSVAAGVLKIAALFGKTTPGNANEGGLSRAAFTPQGMGESRPLYVIGSVDISNGKLFLRSGASELQKYMRNKGLS